ncbi:MAG TPA: C1 family peptidase [Nostocaceae cyanobacterium]|nr:C1 family peptidase [Nostocaceae cyanobacterium]
MSLDRTIRQVSSFLHSSGKQFKIGGYLPDTVQPDDKKYTVGRFQAKELPPRVDLRPHMTTVEQQGEVGSCTANAMAGAYEYLANRQFGWADDVSRLFIYYNARDYDGNTNKDAGTYLRSCIHVLKEYGACKETTWPYNTKKLFTEPHAEAYEEASQFLIDEAERVDVNLYAMRHCLAEGYPFAFGMLIFESFMNPGKKGIISMPKPNQEKSMGGHAMLCVGYSDTDKVFVVRNSWGKEWGDKGYCYIPYDYMTNPELNGDCWTIKSVTDVDLSEEVWEEEGSFFGAISSLASSILASRDEDEEEYDEEEYDEDEEEYDEDEEEEYE